VDHRGSRGSRPRHLNHAAVVDRQMLPFLRAPTGPVVFDGEGGATVSSNAQLFSILRRLDVSLFLLKEKWVNPKVQRRRNYLMT
jgi:hypothetical protein